MISNILISQNYMQLFLFIMNQTIRNESFNGRVAMSKNIRMKQVLGVAFYIAYKEKYVFISIMPLINI